MRTLLLCLSLCCTTLAYGQQARTLEKVVEIAEKDLIPEGIAYNSVKDEFYIGSIHKSKIIKVDAQSRVSDFVKTGTHGNWAYTGMKADEQKQVLWTCRNQMRTAADSAGWGGVFAYDLNSGKLLKKYLVPKKEGKHLLNDIALHQGHVYITDSEGGGVFVIRPGADSLETFIKAQTFTYPNGITLSPEGTSLIVATARGLQKIKLDTREVTPLPFPSYYVVGIDGLYTYKGKLIGMQNAVAPESINRYTLDSKAENITGLELLSVNEPVFIKATTAAIKGNHLYFIANSHIDQLQEDGSLKDSRQLKNLQIYRVRLD